MRNYYKKQKYTIYKNNNYDFCSLVTGELFAFTADRWPYAVDNDELAPNVTDVKCSAPSFLRPLVPATVLSDDDDADVDVDDDADDNEHKDSADDYGWN